MVSYLLWAPLLNHLIENWNILRSSLLPNLINNVALNSVSHGNKDLKLFEAGKVFNLNAGQYSEYAELGIVVTGSMGPASWLQKQNEGGFFFLKGLLEGLFHDLGLSFELRDATNDLFDSACAVEIINGDDKIGIIGELRSKILKLQDIKERVYYAELDLRLLEGKQKDKKEFSQLPKFPSNRRDISFIVASDLKAGEILSYIQKGGFSKLENAEIVDLYRGDSIEKGKKSVTYSLTYRDNTKTLTDGEVDSINNDIIQKVMSIFSATIRQ